MGFENVFAVFVFLINGLTSIFHVSVLANSDFQQGKHATLERREVKGRWEASPKVDRDRHVELGRHAPYSFL